MNASVTGIPRAGIPLRYAQMLHACFAVLFS